jgi:peptidoglycan-N-acetylglucosamine deacetylase
MLIYPARIPRSIQAGLGGAVWHLDDPGDAVYLTFDDGPIPEVTPWVLDQLAGFGAKGTFFCIGRNAGENPALMDRIRQEGHAVGNHTWDHADGWRTPLYAYLRGVLRCQSLTGTRLFRPPYGHITPAQATALRKRFDVVMWEVLSGDFDTSIDGERCTSNVLRHARPGSIIVFHDSTKAQERLRYTLPRVLEAFRERGWAMLGLPQDLRA